MTYTLIGTTPISTAVGAVTTTTGLTGASFASTATSFHGRLDAEWGDGPLHDGAVGGATVASTVPPRVHKHEALDRRHRRRLRCRHRRLPRHKARHHARRRLRCCLPACCRRREWHTRAVHRHGATSHAEYRARDSLGGSHVEPPNSHPGRPRGWGPPHRSTGTRFRDHPHRGVVPLRLEKRYKLAPPGATRDQLATRHGVGGVGVGGVCNRRRPARRDARLLILKAGCEPTSLGHSVGRARPFMDVAACSAAT